MRPPQYHPRIELSKKEKKFVLSARYAPVVLPVKVAAVS
jgi:hypothetical protein